MTAREHVIAALKASGPMTCKQLRKHGVKGANLASILSTARQAGAIVKLGGSARQSVYGLPGQRLPA